METKYLVTYSYFSKYGYEGQELNRVFVTVNGEMTEDSIRDIEEKLTRNGEEKTCLERYKVRVVSFVKLGDKNSGTGEVLYCRS